MKIVVWNSFGAKWDRFWDYYFSPAVNTDANTVGLLVESGWAPWIQSGEVKWSSVYTLPTDKEPLLNETGAAKSTFCQGILASRGNAVWVPWQWDLEGNANSRCSLGGGVVLTDFLLERSQFNDSKLIRPVIRFVLRRGQINRFVILLVHFISSSGKAPGEAKSLIAFSRQFLMEGTPAIIVGDLNINLLKKNFDLPDKWRILRTNGPTQQSGGELDWALLHDPQDRLPRSKVTMLDQYKTNHNTSDHAVLEYDLDLDTR